MTDDRMDALLRDVGGRWRAANADAVETAEPMPSARQPRRWGLLASAAVVVAVLGTGGAVALSGLDGRSDESAATGSAGLTGTVWRLLGDRGVTSYATLYIGPDGKLVADDSCQVIGADVRRDGGTLVASDVRVRYRGCTDSVGEVAFDPGFVDALGTRPRFEVDGRTLRIDGKGEAYRFEADPALPRPTADVPTFDEARWKLVGVQDPTGGALEVPADVTLRVTDGRLTTTDGCNTLTGRVGTRNGSTVDGSGLSVTEMACPGRMDTASVLNKVFSGRFRQSVVGNRLTVTRAGAGTLTYEWVPDDTVGTDPARLVGPTWRLTGVAGKSPAAPLSLRFTSDTNYVADLGCRRSTGYAKLSPGIFRLVGVPDDDQGCRPQTSTIAGFLASDPLWRIQNGKLLVFGGGAQAFSLVYAGGGSGVQSLAGRWSLLSVEPGAGQGTAATPAFLVFTARSIRIEGGCAAATTPYTVQGNSIVLSRPLAVPACAPPPNLAVLDVFGARGRVSLMVEGKTMTITRNRTTLRLARS